MLGLFYGQRPQFLFNDAKASYCRVKRVGKGSKEVGMDETHGNSLDSNSNLKATSNYGKTGVKGRNASSKATKSSIKFQSASEMTPDAPESGPVTNGMDTTATFEWEPHPRDSLKERVDWAGELMTTFDGWGWNWGKDLPEHVQMRMRTVENLNGNGKTRPIHQRLFEIQQTKSLLRRSFQRLIFGYIGLDIIKTIGALDPYFWGYVEHPAPAYLPYYIQSRPGLVTGYRLLIAQISIYLALETVLCLRPLYYVGLRKRDVSSVRGEWWMYPDDFGEFSVILERGLAGWWGAWWHQSFRFVFEAPSKYLQLHSQRTFYSRVLRLFIAFSCSGFLHTCASYTSIGKTNPLSAAFLFFFLQPFGVIGQLSYLKLLRKTGVSPYIPRHLAWAANVVFVYYWLYLTAPLLIDDLARGGQFLYEPVPFSIVRGLGLGDKDMQFYCWRGRWFSWHEGRRWWQSGIVS